MGGVAAVILAAGGGARFGRPKATVPIGAATLLQRAVAVADAAGLGPVVAVVPRGTDAPPPARAVVNDHVAEGLSESLRLGLAAVREGADAAMVMLVDQPTVGAVLLERILGRRGEGAVVAPAHAGVLGPPLLVERRAFDLALEVRGDVGLRRVLDAHPEVVTVLELDGPIPDVDTADDLARLGEPCRGCGALLQPTDGETHAYIGASPACWAAYGELLAREFGDAGYAVVHRHSADTYAAQHPGVDGTRQRQSVALHLIALCHWLEHGAGPRELNPVTQRLASERRDWPWLSPPVAYGVTVLDVLGATDAESHRRLVRTWAESVWRTWAPHHDLIRRWAAEAHPGGG